jgi:hypothetical protein
MSGLSGEIVPGAWCHTQTDIPIEYKSVVFLRISHVACTCLQYLSSGHPWYNTEGNLKVVSIDDYLRPMALERV